MRIVKYVKHYFAHFRDGLMLLEIMVLVDQFERDHNKDDAESSRPTPEPLWAVITLEHITGLGAIIDGDDITILVNQACSAMRGYRLKAISDMALEDYSVAPIMNPCRRQSTPVPSRS